MGSTREEDGEEEGGGWRWMGIEGRRIGRRMGRRWEEEGE